MKAAIIKEHSELDKINVTELSRPEPGPDEILIQVKSAALQLATLAGADVIATSSSDEKLNKAEQIGAKRTINYKEKDVSVCRGL